MHQDALNRVRAFTGGIMVMACPVLLAIAVNQVNPKTERHKLVVGMISMAALTLEVGVFPFVSLCLSNATANLCPDISVYLFVASQLLVHLCAMLLMALAYGILLLISMGNLVYVCLVIVFVVFTLLLCYLSFQNSLATAADPTTTNSQGTATDQTNTSESDGDRQKQVVTMLENLVEFSVAGTSIMFLGLEGLALARMTTTTPTPTPVLDRGPLKAWLDASFFTCLFGVFVMLPGVVPVPALVTSGNGDRATTKPKPVEILNIALATSIVATVILITAAAVKTILAWVVVVPATISFLLWMFIETFCGESIGQDVKPASLDLTKVTFTGFLAVSMMAIGNGNHHPVSFYEQAFILLTSAAVITGIGWRLLTHRTGQSRAVVVAATVASIWAHVCVAAAVVPFAVMAFERAGAPGPGPAASPEA